jgi:hypothetical protein
MNDFPRECVNKSLKRLAKSINLNECIIEELGCACKMENWNDNVVDQIKEAQTLLGQALATLVNWFDDEDVDDK